VNADTGHAEARYISANRHFAKSALGRYPPQRFVDLVAEHRIAFHEKTLGQLFCDGSARQIVAMLLDECARGPGSVDFTYGQSVATVDHADAAYRVTAGGRTALAPRLIVATGGPSIPKMGATGFAYDLARRFGLKIVEPAPALVPLTLGGDDVLFRELSGVSADVIAQCGKTSFREAALLTHRGLSGPAILQISSYWRSGQALTVNFLPDAPSGWLLAAKRSQPRASLRSTLAAALPARLADTLAARLGDVRPLSDLSDRILTARADQLARWPFTPNGTEGYAKAEVTRGGVSTADLSQQTLEARRVPGLHIIGEAVDVTGWLGGYNFQWAWASGVAAGEAV
jgi:predicted Rossmann fold flavoprotein